MNIAILIPTLEGGGAERAASVLGNYLVENGNNVFYFLPFYRENNEAYEVKGKIIDLNIASFLRRLDVDTEEIFIKNMYLAAKEVGRIKKEYKIDVSISFMELCNYLNALSGGKDRKILSVRTVISTHIGRYYYYSKKLFKTIFSLADCIVAVSNYVKEDIINTYGLDAKRIVVIPNAAIKQGNERIEEVWPYGEESIVYVGRLVDEKQVDRIIRAFSFVKKECSNANLFILGQGPQLDYLKWLVRNYRLDESVFFRGFVNDIGFYLRNANSFVMSSKIEGFPNAMVEAMSYGTPIISTNSPGGCREILGSSGDVLDLKMCTYGIITPYIKGKAPVATGIEHEEEILGKAMIMMLTDRKIREKYKEMSLERAKYYSLNTIMNCWQKVILNEEIRDE